MLDPSLPEGGHGSPFQSGFSALDPTQGEVPSVGATHPTSDRDEDKALQTVLAMSPVLPSQAALGASSWAVNSLAVARCLRDKLTSI